MTYQTISDLNQTGISGIFVTASTAVPMLPMLLLGAIFVIITFATYNSTRRIYGRGDMPASCTVAGFVMLVVALLMSLIPGFLPDNYAMNPIPYCIILEITFGLWLLTSKE